MQLATLRPLVDQPGPWASVYLDASHDTEDAAKVMELRWRSARESLVAAGCDPETVTALENAVTELPARPGRHGVVLFATRGDVVMSQALSAPPREIAVFEPLPHVMPMIVQRGEEIPYLRVVVDHTGGEIEAVEGGNLVRQQTVDGGETFPVKKPGGRGGWSALRYEHSVDETWRRNAGDVAAKVTEVADRTEPEIIVVAGDPQSRPLLVSQLPERWQRRVVETDAGSRGAGADQGALDDVTIQAIAERAATHQQDVLDRFRTQLGAGGAAENGLHGVVTALQRGQVDTLLIIDDPSSTAELWIGPQPHEIADDPGFLRDSGVAEPQRVRADAAMIRALAGTDAGIVLVDPDEKDLDGGVAALLRYASVHS